MILKPFVCKDCGKWKYIKVEKVLPAAKLFRFFEPLNIRCSDCEMFLNPTEELWLKDRVLFWQAAFEKAKRKIRSEQILSRKTR